MMLITAVTTFETTRVKTMTIGFHFIRDIVTHPVICMAVSVYISDLDSVASRDSPTIRLP